MERPPGDVCPGLGPVEAYLWNDGALDEKEPFRINPRRAPMAIYEVHLGSFRRVPEEGNRSLTYREIAPILIAQMKRFGFTHLELLPVAEYPFEGSWGYQVTGYYAPTSRYGTPDDFRFLVDSLHQAGLGVILDWVPAHFPKDDYSLRWFDGTALYEHADPRKGEHQDWGTLIFNFGRNEVRNFLLANALFWLDQYHIDGLRVDAVASMLYLDYSRKEGRMDPQSIRRPGKPGGHRLSKELEREGLRTLSPAVSPWPRSPPTGPGSVPRSIWGVWVLVSNGTWAGCTTPCSIFPKTRSTGVTITIDLTFSMLYAYTENFILPLSHDEVVHGKGSLLSKMPGDTWQKFANLRTLLGYMYTHPGKKLLIHGHRTGHGPGMGS